jgi:hypothetical protein
LDRPDSLSTDERRAERREEIPEEKELELDLPDIPKADLTLDFSSFIIPDSGV